MTTLKPIEKWKFDLQIVIAIIGMFIFCCQGLMYFIFELADMRWQAPRYILSYASIATGLILLGFQIMLFNPYPRIKNLLIVLFIIRAFDVLKNLALRSFVKSMDAIQILEAFDALLDLGLVIITVVCFANVLTKKFNTTPLVKMFRTYAIVSIFISIIVFSFNSFFGFGALIHISLFKIWPIVYFMLPVPYLFLILYYQKIKTIYSQLVEGKHEEPAENWPPPSTI